MTMITPSYLGETIEYSSLHACRSTLEDPTPSTDFQRLALRAHSFVVVEMSNGQMLDDVRLALNGARPVEFLNRMGGNVPSHEEVLRFVLAIAKKEQMAHV